jgi:hypothetical protein
MDSFAFELSESVDTFLVEHNKLQSEFQEIAGAIDKEYKVYSEQLASMETLRRDANAEQLELIDKMSELIKQKYATFEKNRIAHKSLETQLLENKQAMKKCLATLLDAYTRLDGVLFTHSSDEHNDDTVVNVGKVLYKTVNYQLRKDPVLSSSGEVDNSVCIAPLNCANSDSSTALYADAFPEASSE